jgi:hypothetical protein
MGTLWAGYYVAANVLVFAVSDVIAYPSLPELSLPSPKTPWAISTSTCLAQSWASRFKRNVLHFVGQPDSRTTAFHLPAGVLTIVAICSDDLALYL